MELYVFGITDEGDFFYVMEHLNGMDLRTIVKHDGPLPPARAVYLLKQACISLGEAHDAGMVHRDVKPENLFACQLGPHLDFLKLLDFGIVRAGADTDHSATSIGEIKGTPSCLSPEAAKAEEATAASDLYSLGCVAYWLLTGRHVFEAANVMQMLMQHISKAPKSLRFYQPDIPKELDELILQCLSKAPEDRPSSATQLHHLLAQVPLADSWNNVQAQLWWQNSSSSPKPLHSSEDTSLFSISDIPTPHGEEHPTRDVLERWLHQKLPTDQALKVEEHLEECDFCAEMLNDFENTILNDSLVDRIREVQ